MFWWLVYSSGFQPEIHVFLGYVARLLWVLEYNIHNGGNHKINYKIHRNVRKNNQICINLLKRFDMKITNKKKVCLCYLTECKKRKGHVYKIWGTQKCKGYVKEKMYVKLGSTDLFECKYVLEVQENILISNKTYILGKKLFSVLFSTKLSNTSCIITRKHETSVFSDRFFGNELL